MGKASRPSWLATAGWQQRIGAHGAPKLMIGALGIRRERGTESESLCANSPGPVGAKPN